MKYMQKRQIGIDVEKVIKSASLIENSTSDDLLTNLELLRYSLKNTLSHEDIFTQREREKINKYISIAENSSSESEIKRMAFSIRQYMQSILDRNVPFLFHAVAFNEHFFSVCECIFIWIIALTLIMKILL